MTGPVVVACASCAGLTFTLDECRCVSGGDRFLVDADQSDRRPYQDCLLCRGTGTVAHPCYRCGQHGLRRAQLVLTVVNADTGAVASASVTPGGIEPRPAPGGRWELALTPIVRELAGTVGAAEPSDISSARHPLDEVTIPLSRDWRPELPADRRAAAVAEALATWAHHPWRVFLGRTSPAPPVDPDLALARLCRLADQLRLDLVVEARHTGYGGLVWDIRYETPGAAVPATPHGYAEQLPEAVTSTSVRDAFDGLAARSLGAPAHYLRTGPPTGAVLPADPPRTVDVDQVERRVLRDCAGRSGAQAIWRDGRWWHGSLRPGGSTEVLTEEPTGQVRRRLTTVLLRTWEPPAPSWLGEPIPFRDCPDCDPGSRLRACLCTVGDRPADPTCASCDGVGVRPWHLPCHTCGDSRRIYRGAVVTVTDLADGVVHDQWRHSDRVTPAKPSRVGVAGDPDPVGDPASEVAPLVATQPGGKPVVRLPERYRLGRLAIGLGHRPDDLTQLDGGGQVFQDLCDGIVTLHRSDRDPLAEQIALVTRGQPGGRLLLSACPPEAPSLAELIRVALGLHLAVMITVVDHRLDADDPLRVHGLRWDIEISAVHLPVALVCPPFQPSLPAAIAECLVYLELALFATVPTDPRQPIPVPQTPYPAAVATPDRLISRLAYHHPGEPITVRLDRTDCTVHLHGDGVARLLAKAPDLPAAVATLGLPPSDGLP